MLYFSDNGQDGNPQLVTSTQRQEILGHLQFNAVHNASAYYHLGTNGGDSFTRNLSAKKFTYDKDTLRQALILDPTYGKAAKFVLDAMDQAVKSDGTPKYEFSVEWLALRHFDGTEDGVYVDTGAPDMDTAKQWAMNALREWAGDNTDLTHSNSFALANGLNFFPSLARKWARHFYWDDQGKYGTPGAPLPAALQDKDAPVTSLASTLDFLYLFSRNAAGDDGNWEMYASVESDSLTADSLPQMYLWVFVDVNNLVTAKLAFNKFARAAGLSPAPPVNIPSLIGSLDANFDVTQQCGGFSTDYWEWDTAATKPSPVTSGRLKGSFPAADQTHHAAFYFYLGALHNDGNGHPSDSSLNVFSLPNTLKATGDYPGPETPGFHGIAPNQGDYHLGVVAADLGAEYDQFPGAKGAQMAARYKLAYWQAIGDAGRTVSP